MMSWECGTSDTKAHGLLHWLTRASIITKLVFSRIVIGGTKWLIVSAINTQVGFQIIVLKIALPCINYCLVSVYMQTDMYNYVETCSWAWPDCP